MVSSQATAAQVTTLAAFHEWFHNEHRCYSVARQAEILYPSQPAEVKKPGTPVGVGYRAQGPEWRQLGGTASRGLAEVMYLRGLTRHYIAESAALIHRH
eukprot:770681-Prorocentrum_minimum.AAC.1